MNIRGREQHRLFGLHISEMIVSPVHIAVSFKRHYKVAVKGNSTGHVITKEDVVSYQ